MLRTFCTSPDNVRQAQTLKSVPNGEKNRRRLTRRERGWAVG